MRAAKEDEGRRKHQLELRYSIYLLFVVLVLLSGVHILLSQLSISVTYRYVLGAGLSAIFGVTIAELLAKGVESYVIVNGVGQEAKTIANLFRIVAYSVVVIVVLDLLNVNVTGLLVSAGFLGIVLGLAAQSTLGNIFAGISMISSRPFKPGDFITVHAWEYGIQPPNYTRGAFIPGYVGTVEKIGLLYTELINEAKVPIYIPNSVLNGALVINHYKARGNLLDFEFELERAMPFNRIKAKLVSILKEKRLYNKDAIELQYITSASYRIAVNLNLADKEMDPDKLKSAILEQIIQYADSLKSKEKRR